MASGLPLNTFKNVPLAITTSLQTVYTAPLGITTIVLMAQASNVVSTAANVSFVHYSYRTGITTYLVKDIAVPPNDARMLLGGKLVLETGDQIKIQASANSALQFIASILETANQ
jgi:hypothetical protein